MSLLRIAPFLHKTTARGNGHSMVSAVALSVDAIERSWLGLCMGVFSAPGSTAGDGQRERRERLFWGRGVGAVNCAFGRTWEKKGLSEQPDGASWKSVRLPCHSCHRVRDLDVT